MRSHGSRLSNQRMVSPSTLGSISEDGGQNQEPANNRPGPSSQRPVPPGLRDINKKKFDSATSNTTSQTGSKTNLSRGESGTSGFFSSVHRFSLGFGARDAKNREESDTAASNWWLLNSRKGGEAIRSRTDGISTIPSKPATFLQPAWRQVKPRSSILAQLSKSIFSFGSAGAALRKKKEAEKSKKFVPDDDDDEGLFEDAGGDQVAPPYK